MTHSKHTLTMTAVAAVLILLSAPAWADKADKAATKAHVLAGDSLRTRGDLDAAMREYIAALAIGQSDCGAHYGMARISLAHNDIPTAAKHAEEAAEDKDCDLGLVAYEMTLLADKMRGTLTPATR